MGFIIIAKGRQGLFFLSELAWTMVAVSLAWLGVGTFGVTGAGIAFFGSYVFHGFLTYPIARCSVASAGPLRTGKLVAISCP